MQFTGRRIHAIRKKEKAALTGKTGTPGARRLRLSLNVF